MSAAAVARSRGLFVLLALGGLGCATSMRPAPHLRSRQLAERCLLAGFSGESGEAAAGELELGEWPPPLLEIARAAGLRSDDIAPGELGARIVLRLLRLKIELSAAEAYMDCLGDSLEDLQREVTDRRDAHELYLTLGSIGLGAAAGIGAGAVELREPDSSLVPVLGIAGGVGAAALGILAFFAPTPKVRLEHRTNVLRSVWRGEPGADLPRFVWALLAAPRPEGASLLEQARTEWKRMLDEEDEARREELTALLFGDGGLYDLHALRVREAMYDLLETDIGLLNQEFRALVAHVEALAQGSGSE